MFVITGTTMTTSPVVTGPFGSRDEAKRFLTKQGWSKKRYQIIRMVTPAMYVTAVSK